MYRRATHAGELAAGAAHSRLSRMALAGRAPRYSCTLKFRNIATAPDCANSDTERAAELRCRLAECCRGARPFLGCGAHREVCDDRSVWCNADSEQHIAVEDEDQAACVHRDGNRGKASGTRDASPRSIRAARRQRSSSTRASPWAG